MLAKPDNPGQSAFEFQALPLEDPVSNMANLRLGMAVTMMHVIRWALEQHAHGCCGLNSPAAQATNGQ